MAINDGCDLIKKIRKARHLSVYHLSGRFGRATLNFAETGKIIEKTSFSKKNYKYFHFPALKFFLFWSVQEHITEEKINKTGRSIITKYQKLAFE